MPLHARPLHGRPAGRRAAHRRAHDRRRRRARHDVHRPDDDVAGIDALLARGCAASAASTSRSTSTRPAAASSCPFARPGPRVGLPPASRCARSTSPATSSGSSTRASAGWCSATRRPAGGARLLRELPRRARRDVHAQLLRPAPRWSSPSTTTSSASGARATRDRPGDARNAPSARRRARRDGRASSVVRGEPRLPLVPWTWRDGEPFTGTTLVDQLARLRGWMVPAYSLPPDAEDVTLLRMVVKENLTRVMADQFLADLADRGRRPAQARRGRAGAAARAPPRAPGHRVLTRPWRTAAAAPPHRPAGAPSAWSGRPTSAWAEVLPEGGRPWRRLLRLDDEDCSHVDLRDPTHLDFAYVRRLGDVVDVRRAAGRPDRRAAPRGRRVHAAALRRRHAAGLAPGRRRGRRRPGRAGARAPRPAPVSGAARAARRRPRRPGAARRPRRPTSSCSTRTWAREIPAHLVTTGFAALARRALRPGGILAANVIDAPPMDATRALAATLGTAFDARRAGRRAQARAPPPGRQRGPAGRPAAAAGRRRCARAPCAAARPRSWSTGPDLDAFVGGARAVGRRARPPAGRAGIRPRPPRPDRMSTVPPRRPRRSRRPCPTS